MESQKKVTASIQEDKGTWVVRGRIYDLETGKTQQRSKSTKLKVNKNTKRKALQMMKEITKQWEREANGEIPVMRAEPTVGDYVNAWLDKKQAVIRGNTVTTYQGYARVHIIPALGTIPVSKLSLPQLQGFYNVLLEKLSVNSIRKINVVVSGALLDALRDGWISSNIAEYVELPKTQKFQGASYTPEQAAQLLHAAEREKERLRAAVTLALCYGLRREEILGLRWSDLDFEKGTLFVRNTIVREGTLRLEEERTKTAKSRRVIGLVKSTVPYLIELRRMQQERGLPMDKVCAWPNGKEVRPDYLTRHVPKLMKKAGLPVIRLHDLRHTAVSMLVLTCTPKQMQEFLGHEDIATTMNIYTHLMDSERRATSDAMGDILEKSGFCSEKCSESPDGKVIRFGDIA